jgi:hypothetical protein
VRTVLSDYRVLRAKFGLRRYGADDMIALLNRAGFDAWRAPRNTGHNRTRMSFVATPRGRG